MTGTAVDVTPAFTLSEHAAQVFKAHGRNQRTDGGKLSPVGMTAEGQGNIMFKSFVDEGRVMGQHDDKGIVGNAVQGLADIVLPLGGKGFIALGKTVVRTGNIEGPAVAAVPPLQAPA